MNPNNLTVIENIRTGERWTIEDGVNFPASEFRVIDNLANLIKKEENEAKLVQVKEYVNKCLLKPNFCNRYLTYDYT